jgi:hypothetical protein
VITWLASVLFIERFVVCLPLTSSYFQAKNSQKNKRNVMPQKQKARNVMPQQQKANRQTNAGLGKDLSVNHTLDKIERTLIRGLTSGGTTKGLSDYVHCRLNPFKGSGRSGIPDGGNDKFIVSDLFTYDTIALNGNNNFTIQTLPTYPCSAAITFAPASTPTPLLVNGNIFNAPTNFGGGATGNNALYPISVPSQYVSPVANSMTPGSNYSDPYNSTSLRQVAVGYRLIYTGPVFDCSGSLTVTPNSLTVIPCGPTNSSTASATGTILTVLNPGQTTTNKTCNAGTNCLTVNGNILGNAFVSGSVTFRPEQGIIFVPKHRSKDFKVIPQADNPWGLVNNSGIASTGTTSGNSFVNYLCSNNSASTGVYSGGVIWYDNDWSGVTINGVGLNEDATFRWETVYCMEFQPTTNSTLAEFTRGAQKESPRDIDLAQKLSGEAPLVMPMAT